MLPILTPGEAAARDEAYLAQVLHQQDAQSVIAFGRAYAPAAEQIDGERERIAARDVVDGDDGDLQRRYAAGAPRARSRAAPSASPSACPRTTRSGTARRPARTPRRRRASAGAASASPRGPSSA